MTNQATIIHKKPGFLVPDATLLLATTKMPTAFGFAGQENGVLKVEVLPKQLPLGELKELQLAFKDSHLVMFFANFPKAVIPDDVQPWTINGEDGNPMLSIFCTGNAKNYEGLNGDHTGEYCASDEIIFPRLEKAAQVANNDIDKLMEEIKKKGLQNVMMGTFEDEGGYVFLAGTGDPICFGNWGMGGEFSWGRTSNTLGYSESSSAPVVEKAKEAVKTGLSFLRGGGAPATATAPASAPVEVPQPNVTPAPALQPPADPPAGPAVPPDPKDPSTWTPQQLEAKGYRKIFPPPKLGKNGKARNLWLRSFNCLKPGHLPTDHESPECSVWVTSDLLDLAKRIVSSKGEVENIATHINRLRKGGNSTISEGSGVVMATTSAEQKAIETAELARMELLEKDEKPITRSTTREKYVPNAGTHIAVMSDDQKLAAMLKMDEFFKKDKRPSPLEMQKSESKHATYTEATGRERNDLIFMTAAEIDEIIGGNPVALSMILELRHRLIEEAGLKLEDLVMPKTEEPIVEPVKVPEPAPAKTGGALSFLRGRAA